VSKSALPFWPTSERTKLPAAATLPAYLSDAEFYVPSRREGRQKEHREGFCIIAALRWLGAAQPDAFPATLIRAEAPDFLLFPQNGGPTWAFEQSDAGEEQYQRWLAVTEAQTAVKFIPSPGDDGWVGDAPERAHAEAIRLAVERKSKAKFWRNAPIDAIRCVLLYDQTNTALFVDDEHAERALKSAVSASISSNMAVIAMLVRGRSEVLFAGEMPNAAR
jgi:hypothetical protein